RTADHFHAPAGPGTNAAVIYDLGSITTGTTAGSILGTVTLTNTTTQINQLESGLWYLNIHSSTFPGAEIRRHVMPVLEPSVRVISGAGLAWLVVRRRRR